MSGSPRKGDLGFLLPCVRKHYNHKQLVKRKGLCHAPLLREVSTAAKTGQEPGGKIWYRSHEEVLLTMLPVTCSASFLIAPKTICLRMAPLPVASALSNQL